MGYSSEMFEHINKLGLPKGARVLDMGSQDVGVSSQADIDCINAFIGREAIVSPGTVEAREIYELAGYGYTCTDVDSRPNTVRVDLGRLKFPKSLRNKFDLVTNCGTTEHLSNPVGGFAFVHYCTKPGGLMFHDVPLYGFANHGFMNPTPKFWHALTWMNRYALIHGEVRQIDESQIPDGNFFHDAWKMNGVFRSQSAMVRMIFRKNDEGVFITPYDAEVRTDREAYALVMGSTKPFSKAGTYGRLEALIGVRNFAYRDRPDLIVRIARRLMSPRRAPE